MWTGDSLTVILFLAGSSLALLIGSTGVRSDGAVSGLRLGSLLFAFALIVWLLLPTAGPIASSLAPVVSAMATSNAFFMVLVVSVVALMNRRNPERANSASEPLLPSERLPSFATDEPSKWEPDTSLQHGILYLGSKSEWRDPFRAGNTVEGTVDALVEALAKNQITGWAREHPDDGELLRVSPMAWHNADVTAKTAYAFSKTENTGMYNIHVCQREMEQIWPPRPSEDQS